MNRFAAFFNMLYAAVAIVGCTGNAAQNCASSLFPKDTVEMCFICVDCKGGSDAVVSLFQRDSTGEWRRIFETDGYIGRNGLASPEGTKREGDGKTPEGEIKIVSAFGIKDNPGTSMPYLKVTSDHWGCDEDCEYYNTIINSSVTGHKCKGEHLVNVAPAYNYAIVTSYNQECIKGMGSLIFLHCIGDKPYTAGCVAIPEKYMVEVLRRCTTGTVISIH